MKSRADGHASWCKRCSNSSRKFHKKSGKKPEYKVVADAVSKEGKPRACPKCSKHTPSHKMRGYLVEGEIRWSCVSCRSDALAKARQVKLYCDWCCDEFHVPPSSAHKRFCGQECMDTWREAKRSAKEDERQPVAG